MRALLIGKRAAILGRVKANLDDAGVPADFSTDLSRLPDPATTGVDWSEYSVVVFGRAVPPTNRDTMLAQLRDAQPTIVHVTGLAPITEVITAQVQEAFDHRPIRERQLADIAVDNSDLILVLAAPAAVEVTLYRLDVLYRTHRDVLFDEPLPAGRHTLPLEPKYLRAKDACLTVRADNDIHALSLGRMTHGPQH